MNTKNLIKIYNKCTVKNQYYELEYFLRDSKRLLKLIKDCKPNNKLYLSMEVSRSGMLRKFNFDSTYNSVLNITYNQKNTFDPVRVGGCGMDMLWHLLYRFCEDATSKKMMEKWGLNSKCSHCTRLL